MDFYASYNRPFPMTPRQHIRKRPGMYIGGTDARALHHLVYAVMDHMVEEAFMGRCDQIMIEIREANKIVIQDNSPGLPVDRYKETPFTWMEVLLQDIATPKHAYQPAIYPITGGLHGLGLPVVNALSERFIVENCRNGVAWRQAYERGMPKSPLTRMEDRSCDSVGTRFVFRPDFTILEPNDFDLRRIERRAQDVALLTPGLTVTMRDTRKSAMDVVSYKYDAGLTTRIHELTASSRPLHEPVHIQREVTILQADGAGKQVAIEIAFQFTTGDQNHLQGYANTVETPDGGTHLTAFRIAIKDCLNQYLHFKFGASVPSFSWDDIAPGLTAIVSIRHPDPQFESPTKRILLMQEIAAPIKYLVYEVFGGADFTRNPEILNTITEYCLARRQAG